MHRTVRHALAVAAATAVAGFGIVVAGPAGAAVRHVCPPNKYCLYDNPDFTKPLVISSERRADWIGSTNNDRVSAVTNNLPETLNLFKDVNVEGPNGVVRHGTSLRLTGILDNQVSSYFVY